jgi:riboflavin kinase/FMN adenylyltransferase
MSMLIIDWADLVRGNAVLPAKPTAFTVGVFDGVHLGHRALIKKIVQKAPEMIPTVLTFRENPKKRAHPEAFFGDIMNFDEKLALLEELGVELCTVIDFSPEFSTLKGTEFFRELYRSLNPVYAVIGQNFRCGYGLDTDAPAFRQLGLEKGVDVEILAPVMEGGLPVSSSRIREALRRGSFDEASKLLGRQITSL